MSRISDARLDKEAKLATIKEQLHSIRRAMRRMKSHPGVFTPSQYGECLIEYARLLGEFHRLKPRPRARTK